MISNCGITTASFDAVGMPTICKNAIFTIS
jgi:hypothetical protein